MTFSAAATFGESFSHKHSKVTSVSLVYCGQYSMVNIWRTRCRLLRMNSRTRRTRCLVPAGDTAADGSCTEAMTSYSARSKVTR